MKKYLPLLLLFLGLIVVFGVYYLVIKGKGEKEIVDDESALQEVPLNERPVVTLTPTKDGHWLKLKIEKIVIKAESLDYELLYKLPDGRTQGVPGTVPLEDQELIEKELLLGSESSGHYRFDEGVEKGTLTLRFRNSKGKLVAKFATEFSLLESEEELSTTDGKFSVTLEEVPEDEFFLLMETIGIPGSPPANILSGPYGIYSSSQVKNPGEIDLGSGNVYQWSGDEWVKLEDSNFADIGIFVSTAE